MTSLIDELALVDRVLPPDEVPEKRNREGVFPVPVPEDDPRVD